MSKKYILDRNALSQSDNALLEVTSLSLSPDTDRSGPLTVEAWFYELQSWYKAVRENCEFVEEVWIYTATVDGQRECRFKVALMPTLAVSLHAGVAADQPSQVPASEADRNTDDAVLSGAISNPSLSDRDPPIGKDGTGDNNSGKKDGISILHAANSRPRGEKLRSREVSSKSIRNQDLADSLILDDPHEYSDISDDSFIADHQSIILPQDAILHSKAGIYGVILRAALMGKVSCAKANLTLYINQLEGLQWLMDEAGRLVEKAPPQKMADRQTSGETSAQRGATSNACTGDKSATDSEKGAKSRTNPGDQSPGLVRLAQRAYLMRAVWKLINRLGEDDEAIPETLRKQLAASDDQKLIEVPTSLGEKPGGGPTRQDYMKALLWYFSTVKLTQWVEKRNEGLTKIGHGLAFAAFISLLALSWGWTDFSAMQNWFGGTALSLPNWLPDGAGVAIGFAVGACCFYAITTQRLKMSERAALLINAKIESALDGSLADLMKGNMDVQIGRLGRDEPVGRVPEHIARRLDEAFAFKEMVNSYESSVRARLRHVAQAVGKAESIRADSQQRIRNAALGVTASFVLLEIGSRIQSHRDLLAGTDPQSYAYWLHRGSSGMSAGEGTAPADVPLTSLTCARTEIVEHLPPSPECLNEWRESALSSSSSLLLLVFFIAMVLFAVRVLRRGSTSASS